MGEWSGCGWGKLVEAVRRQNDQSRNHWSGKQRNLLKTIKRAWLWDSVETSRAREGSVNAFQNYCFQNFSFERISNFEKVYVKLQMKHNIFIFPFLFLIYGGCLLNRVSCRPDWLQAIHVAEDGHESWSSWLPGIRSTCVCLAEFLRQIYQFPKWNQEQKNINWTHDV